MMTKPKKAKALGVAHNAADQEVINFTEDSARRRMITNWNKDRLYYQINGLVTKDQTRSLIAHLQAWLDTGSLEIK